MLVVGARGDSLAGTMTPSDRKKMLLEGPLCPPLEEPAPIGSLDAFVVLATVTQAAAESTARDTIVGSIFRPEDIRGADIGPTRLAYVPFWRIEVAVDGEHVRFAGTIRAGSVSLPLPLPGHSHEDRELYILGRRLFPFRPGVAETAKSRGSLGIHHTTTTGWGGLSIRPDEMTARSSAPPLAGEVVEPDVTRAAAEDEAKRRAVSAARPLNAFYAKYDPVVRTAACCHYPLWVTRYLYDGHASTAPGETYWVLVSGRTGKIVGTHHPSVLRSVTRKLRKLLTFGS
jgi:hypothetical protein